MAPARVQHGDRRLEHVGLPHGATFPRCRSPARRPRRSPVRDGGRVRETARPTLSAFVCDALKTVVESGCRQRAFITATPGWSKWLESDDRSASSRADPNRKHRQSHCRKHRLGGAENTRARKYARFARTSLPTRPMPAQNKCPTAHPRIGRLPRPQYMYIYIYIYIYVCVYM